MPNWLGKCLCIIAAIGVFDGHLMIAQTWAWATMLADRSSERGLSEAVDSTFSGEEPCPMCCAIEEERNKDQQRDKRAPARENESPRLLIATSCVDHLSEQTAPRVITSSPLTADRAWLYFSRSDKPALPPPRHG